MQVRIFFDVMDLHFIFVLCARSFTFLVRISPSPSTCIWSVVAGSYMNIKIKASISLCIKLNVSAHKFHHHQEIWKSSAANKFKYHFAFTNKRTITTMSVKRKCYTIKEENKQIYQAWAMYKKSQHSSKKILRRKEVMLLFSFGFSFLIEKVSLMSSSKHKGSPKYM